MNAEAQQNPPIPPDTSFLNVRQLLETSLPKPRMRWLPAGAIGFLLALLLASRAASGGAAAQAIFTFLWTAGFGILVLSLGLSSFFASRALRNEQRRLEQIEELIQLQRWPDAAQYVQWFLSKPARTHPARAQGLLYLGMTLSRYHRFEEAISAYDYLLKELPLDPSAQHAIRLARGMALVQEENLLDADRAIAELRRETRGTESAGLTLLELFRDVKTGHPQEAIEMFESRLPLLRKNLGHRVGDAWALAARAYDLLGKMAQATAAYQNATLLVPLGELQRRYPEIVPLAQKLTATQAPPEVA